jgi:hypothetical protein
MSIIVQQVARVKILWKNALASCEKQNPLGKTFSQLARSKIPSAKRSRRLRERNADVKILSQVVVDELLMADPISLQEECNTTILKCMLFPSPGNPSLQLKIY